MIAKLLIQLKTDIETIIRSWGIEESIDVFFDIPKDTGFGDYSTNVAMRLSKILRKNPISIANDIVKQISLEKNKLSRCEIAGAGFINFFWDRDYLSHVIFDIVKQEKQYGNLHLGSSERINLEFVSANPTGSLHIGHGRGASYGDSLSRILRKAGYHVTKEHYVNDGGNQINNLAKSIYERYKSLFGLPCVLEEGYYHGKEIITVAQHIKDHVDDKYLQEPWYDYFRQYGVDYLLEGLKNDLNDFNVTFDVWFSEKTLYDQNAVDATLQYLIENGYTYEHEGAIWLKTSLYNDEKDRVIVKSDQSYTYLLPDIAYHMNKFSRGYTHLIDVLGADHHGYVDRLKAAIACMGGHFENVDVEILQMVRVLQNGEEIKMSKRSGKAITLRDLIDEIGSDALRFMYSSKSLSTHMDLDLDLAIKQSNDNPVYYAQYAYARICSLFRTFDANGFEFTPVTQFIVIDLQKIDKILMVLLQYPQVIEEAAIKRIPHKITQYILNLATQLHSYYNDEKIITDDLLESNEKLTVLRAVQIVLEDSLSLIGVGVKEKM